MEKEKCVYCEVSVRENLFDNHYGITYISGNNNLRFISSDSDCVDEQNINYCPICGRKLSDIIG